MLLLEALVELLEALKLGGETALGGGIDDKDDLALVLLKWLGLAALCRWGSRYVSQGVFFATTTMMLAAAVMIVVVMVVVLRLWCICRPKGQFKALGSARGSNEEGKTAVIHAYASIYAMGAASCVALMRGQRADGARKGWKRRGSAAELTVNGLEVVERGC